MTASQPDSTPDGQSGKLATTVGVAVLAGMVVAAGISVLLKGDRSEPELQADSRREISDTAPAVPIVSTRVQEPIPETRTAAAGTRAGGDSTGTQESETTTVPPTSDSGSEQALEHESPATSGQIAESDAPPVEVFQLKGHTDSIHALAFYSEGRRLASASSDGTVRFWDLTTGKPSGDSLHPGVRINTMAVSPDEQLLLTGNRDGAVQTWDLNSRTRVSEFSVQGGEAYAVDFSPDGKRVISGAENGTVRIRDVESGKELLKIDASVGRVLEVEFSPDATQILCSGTGTRACLYDARTGKELQRYEGHSSSIFSVAFVRGGRQFLSGSSDGSVRLWDVESGKELRRFEGKSGGVFDVELGPGEHCFLSSGSDGTLHVWDLETGRQLHRFDAETHCTGYLAVSPDGRFAASGFGAYPNPSGGAYLKDGEFSVHLWRLPKLPETESLPPGGLPQPELAKVPDEDVQKQAEQQIREVFKQEYAGAKQPAEQAELAETLLRQARTSEDNAVRFVLLREARNLAAEAGDVQTALHAIDELGRIFQINLLEQKADVLENVRKASRQIDVSRTVAAAALELIEEANESENFDIASELVKVARTAARKVKDRELIAHVSRARERIGDRRRELQEFEESKARLKTDPVDADANRFCGLYLCLRRGDWENGLPLLRLSENEALVTIAEQELLSPTESPGQLQLADAWWSEAEATHGALQDAVRHRALHWYIQVLPEVSGLQKAVVEKRIAAFSHLKSDRWKFVGISSFAGEADAFGHPETPDELSGSYSNGIARISGSARHDVQTVNGTRCGWFGKAAVWKVSHPLNGNARLQLDCREVVNYGLIVIMDEQRRLLKRVAIPGVASGESVSVDFSYSAAQNLITIVLASSSNMRIREVVQVAPSRPLYVGCAVAVRDPGDRANVSVRLLDSK